MTLLDAIFLGNVNVTNDYLYTLEKIDWYISNDADYIDIETEVSYRQSLIQKWDYDSFNLAATFDIENSRLYFIFGNNLGEGMNEKLEFRYSPDANISDTFLQAKQECQDAEFVALMDKHPDEVKEINERLLKLIQLIKKEV